jgi:hypothetical protein
MEQETIHVHPGPPKYVAVFVNLGTKRRHGTEGRAAA